MASHSDTTGIIDTDSRFVIDIVTGKIENHSDKESLRQYSHNSERFSFEMPRHVEGHDMTNCTKVTVNYLAADIPGEYEVDDLAVDSEDDDKITFSWLISSNVTQKKGKLRFAVVFECAKEDGTITYRWPTDINYDYEIKETISNDSGIVYENVDILEQWKQQLFYGSNSVTANIQAEGRRQQALVANKGSEVKKSIPDDYATLSDRVSELCDHMDLNIVSYTFSWIGSKKVNTTDGKLFDPGIYAASSLKPCYSNFVTIGDGIDHLEIHRSANDNKMTGGAFYSAASESYFISGFKEDSGNNISVPNGAKYFRINSTTDGSSNLALVVNGIPKETAVEVLKKSVEDIKADAEETNEEIRGLKEDIVDNHRLVQVAINEFDGYRNLSDEVIEEDGMHCVVSDFIPCIPKQKFLYKGFAHALVYSACFFDSNKEVIGHEQYDSEYTYTEVKIPNNCYFVKFQSFEYKPNTVELDFKWTDSTDLKNMLSFPQMEENKRNILKLEKKVGSSIWKYKDLTSELLTLDVYISKQGNAVNAEKGTALGSEYIQVEKGDMFRLTGYANYQVAGICQYDSNMRFLKAQLYSEDNTGYTYTNHEIEIDENTAYIRLCSYDMNSHEYKIEKKCRVSLYDFINDYIDTDNKYDGNILKGKKWTACGDSFTEGDFTGFVDENGLSGKNSPVIYDGNRGMYKTYPWWIAERNNMELVNEAKCGSKFTNIDNATSGNVFSLRYKNVPLDSDYITFMFGLNEVGLTDEQIGTESDSDTTTLWGAYNVIFEYFLTNAPKAKIMVIIPDAWMNKKYADATKTICEHWGIVCKDLKFDTSVTMGIGGRSNVSSKATELRDKAFKVTEENGHPNVTAHEYRSTVIESWMRAL